jgi:mannose-1-phosphate guanylyltransferase
VCNGDVLTTLDLRAFVDFHVEHDATATIHLAQVVDPSALGVVPTYDDGEVKAFIEKPAAGTAPTNWINAGTYMLEPSVLERIPPGLATSIERETFPRLLEDRGQVYALATDDYWIDVGTPEKYLEAHADVLGGRMGSPPTPDAREQAPGVWVVGDADLAPAASLEAPVLIGAGVAVAAGARIARSTLGAGAFIGPDAVVDSSVLLAGARIARGGLVRSSILGIDACVEEDASALDFSIVGAGASVPAGTTLTGGRVPVATPAG